MVKCLTTTYTVPLRLPIRIRLEKSAYCSLHKESFIYSSAVNVNKLTHVINFKMLTFFAGFLRKVIMQAHTSNYSPAPSSFTHTERALIGRVCPLTLWCLSVSFSSPLLVLLATRQTLYIVQDIIFSSVVGFPNCTVHIFQ